MMMASDYSQSSSQRTLGPILILLSVQCSNVKMGPSVRWDGGCSFRCHGMFNA